MAVSMSGANLPLNNGHSIPQLGLGTYKSDPGVAGDAVRMALNIGYRHIDCAEAYGNQTEIGKALKDTFENGKLKREDVFITSKIWNTHHSHGKATEAIDNILREMRLQYIDLILIHFPMGYSEEGDGLAPKDADGKTLYSDIDYLETWRAMEEAVDQGKIRSIGLSNFNIEQIERVIEHGKIKPSVLQVEVHPYLPQYELIEFCKKHKIVITAYCPLANNSHVFRTEGDPNLLEETILKEIARKYDKTPAQVAIRWGLQRGIAVIPKSTRRFRLEENFHVWDFHLSAEDTQAIAGLNRNFRIGHMKQDSDHPYFPFRGEKTPTAD